MLATILAFLKTVLYLLNCLFLEVLKLQAQERSRTWLLLCRSRPFGCSGESISLAGFAEREHREVGFLLASADTGVLV